MGNRRKYLFIKKNFFYNNKYNYLLNHIENNFKFCSKILIICNKKNRKDLKYRNNSKINILYLKSSKNQIETILKCKNKISNNLPILVLN